MKKISEWPKWGRITFYVFVAFLVLICPLLIIPLVAWWVIRRYLRWSAENRLAESAARLESGAAPAKTPFLPHKPKEIAITIVCVLGFIGVCINSCSDSKRGADSNAVRGEEATFVEESIEEFPIDKEKARRISLDELTCRKVNELGVVEKSGNAADTKTFAELKAKADGGDAVAQFKVAVCYVDEIGTPDDFASAFQYAKKSASQGCMEGKCLMWSLFLDGYGDKEKTDVALRREAFTCFEKGADAGIVFAKCLSGLYSSDANVKRRNLLAAIEAGSKLAKVEIARWFAEYQRYHSDEPNYPISANDAIKYIGTLAQEKYLPALLESARWFVDGSMTKFGMGKNAQMAVETYKLAANQGCVEAAYKLSELYRIGDFVERDLQKAWKWLRIVKAFGWNPSTYDEVARLIALVKTYRVNGVESEYLTSFTYSVKRYPEEGRAYAYADDYQWLKVFQKIGRKTYLVRSTAQDSDAMIVLRLAKELDVDAFVPSGVFVCVGTVKYENLRGKKIKAWSFEEAEKR